MKKKSLAVFLWLLLWQGLSLAVGNDILLVGPLETVRALLLLIPERGFWLSILASVLRIGAGLAIGFGTGVLLSFAASLSTSVRCFLSPFVTVTKAVPVASFVILFLIWFGSRWISFFISAMVVFPIVYLNLLEGLNSVDPKMREMAALFRVPFRNRIHYILLPSVRPFLVSAVRLAVGMGLKSGVAAEVIGQPQQSLGGELYQAKIYLDTASLFAWTVVIICLAGFMERLILRIPIFREPKI